MFGAVLGAVRVQSKQARDKVVRVYISSKRLVWWGAGFWDWISISVSVKFGAWFGAMQG